MHRLLRGALFACAFAASAGIVWHVSQRAIVAAGIGPVGLALNLPLTVNAFERVMRKDHGKERIALVGDSTMMKAAGMDAPGRQILPARVHAALRQRGPRGQHMHVHTLCAAGLGPSGLYFISDRLAATQPERVVIGLNLGSFNADTMREFGYPESAGMLAANQLPEAASLPMSDVGLTLDRVLFYKALVSAGAIDAWVALRKTQAQAFKLRDSIASAIEAATHTRALADMQFALAMARIGHAELPGKRRATREMAERMYGPVLSGLARDAAGLRWLDAALARLQHAHVPVLLYLRPMNVEHMRELGLSLERLPVSIAEIRRTAERRGAQVVDLHALLPDGAFTDIGDHYTFDGDPNGTNWLGDRIALAITRSPQRLLAVRSDDAVQ